MRKIFATDESGMHIQVCLWEEKARIFSAIENEIANNGP